MGTKRALVSHISEVVDRSRTGPFLDLFAGMCSVATSVSKYRPVWTNDLQQFATTVAQAYFTSQFGAIDHLRAADLCRRKFLLHSDRLLALCASIAVLEDAALQSRDVERLKELEELDKDRSVINTSSAEQQGLTHYLFASQYAFSYLGLRQAIEIDSIRFCLDDLRHEGALGDELHRWLLLALCRAMSRCATATGHFAQHLSVNENNVKKYSAQRRRSIWHEWLLGVDNLQPVGSSVWRKSNKVFNLEANAALEYCLSTASRPSVIYADPPYTRDQYSRYYHLYETLILYDYPATQGKGRCRAGRSVSDFSLATKVAPAFERLIGQAAKIGADIIINYPAKGLMTNSQDAIPEIMRRYYKTCDEPVLMAHSHSTMGASKGRVRSAVTEVIYRASMQ